MLSGVEPARTSTRQARIDTSARLLTSMRVGVDKGLLVCHCSYCTLTVERGPQIDSSIITMARIVGLHCKNCSQIKQPLFTPLELTRVLYDHFTARTDSKVCFNDNGSYPVARRLQRMILPLCRRDVAQDTYRLQGDRPNRILPFAPQRSTTQHEKEKRIMLVYSLKRMYLARSCSVKL